MKTVKIYDTTLRDGTQGEDVSLSVDDKIKIAEKLDELGVHYIEGGWPGSNPKDAQFFKTVSKMKFKKSSITAFGSTKRPGVKAKDDHNLKAIVESKVKCATIFGKTWDLHVRSALKITLDENLELIYESVKFLKKHLSQVFYDAEHFFDGYKANPKYALKTLNAAKDGGADIVVLCDTNGGSLPGFVSDVVKKTINTLGMPVGIHTHNDGDLAVSNSLAAVEAGCVQVQGTINGLGDRCAYANLCSIIPNLELKMGYKTIGEGNLKRLKEAALYVYEIANILPIKYQPFVGESAFAHKGGIHVSAVQKDSKTYEHIEPGIVGNAQRVLVSDLSGRSNILFKAKEIGIKIEPNHPATKDILEALKSLEHEGYQFEGAEGSFELLMKGFLGLRKKYFELLGFRVITEKFGHDDETAVEATIKVRVGGIVEHTAANGNGPVNALDNALRKALESFYPELKEMHLADFKVRVLTAGKGTSSKVRVLIESQDKTSTWNTVGVSENVIDASWIALTDAFNYKLMKEDEKRRTEK